VSEINSGWTGMIRILMIELLAILAIAIIAMMRFTGRITKPLRDLTEAAKQVDEGNYDFSLEYDKDDEIGVLTRAFMQLAANTKEKITEMEEVDRQKVLINILSNAVKFKGRRHRVHGRGDAEEQRTSGRSA